MNIEKTAQAVVSLLREKNQKVAFAESCTGGMVSSAIISVAGSSQVLDLSIVTYANEAKVKYTHVTDEVLATYGAVSEETARLMARGIHEKAKADFGVGITGIAGPDGGTAKKPVGTVYIAVDSCENQQVKHCLFTGNRQEIREQTTQKALEMLYDCILQTPSCQGKGV